MRAYRLEGGAFLRQAAGRPSSAAAGRVERLAPRRFRASVNGRLGFSAELETEEEALEAASVLDAVEDGLSEAITWGSWPDMRRRRARTAAERYFREIADESRGAARALVPEVRAVLDRDSEWVDDGPGLRAIRTTTVDTRTGARTAYRVEVAEDSLVLTALAATVDRAVAFLMLFTALQRDVREVLGWKPL